MTEEEINLEEVKKKRLWLVLGCFFAFATLFLVAILAYSISRGNEKSDCNILKTAIVSNIINQNEDEHEASSTAEDNLTRRMIDGVKVEKGEENKYPFAAMIDNHPDARPPFGLADANLVYEAEAEGGLTRYLAIFADTESIEKIGPIRSARPYFVDWANELSAVYVHCGGSPDALAQIIKDKIIDMNEFYLAPYFWRSSDRARPHNVMTSTEKLADYAESKSKIEGNFESWLFKDDSADSSATSSKIEIPKYGVEWEFDQENNDYIRYLDGQIHKQDDGKEIRAKNLAIALMGEKVLDEKNRIEVNNIGSGQAIICLDGECRKGIWKKSDKKDRTRFFYDDGAEVEFNAGTTWVEVVRKGLVVKY